jgi:hypothetical protein
MSPSGDGPNPSGAASVSIGDDRYAASGSEPFVFGRADRPGVVGLDPSDMGISAEAGAVEFTWGLWWIVNRSRKRRLLIETAASPTPQRLECGDRYAITRPRIVVLVPGAIYTHRLDIRIPDDAVAELHVTDTATSGTLPFSHVDLSAKDRLVLAVVFGGYLRSFPHHDARPRSYQEAAEQLGPPWTRITVRKQIERIKERFARHGVFFEGPRANDALAEHLLDTGLLGPGDLAAVDGERRVR